MATVNLLSWNIENFGPSRYIRLGVRTPRATPLFKSIADTVVHYDATVFSVIEFAEGVMPGAANELRNWLRFATRAQAGRVAAAASGAAATAAAGPPAAAAAASFFGTAYATNAAAEQGNGTLQAAAIPLVVAASPPLGPAVATAVATEAANRVYGGMTWAQAALPTSATLFAASALDAAMTSQAGANPPAVVLAAANGAAVGVGASTYVAAQTAAAAQAAAGAASLAAGLPGVLAVTNAAIAAEANATAAAAGPRAAQLASETPAAVAAAAGIGPGGVAAMHPNLGAVIGATQTTARGALVGGMAVAVNVANAAGTAAATAAVNAFVNALNLAPAAAWDYQSVPTYDDRYCVYYRTDRGFNIKLDQTAAANPVCGYDASVTATGATLTFPKGDMPKSGRRPGFFTFVTTDRAPNPEVLFTVIVYHAMYGSQTARGIRNIASVSTINTVNVAGAMPMAQGVYAAFISGDFNVDLLLNAGDYANIIALGGHQAVTGAMGNAAKSSLGDYVASANSLAFRSSAYDNIFSRNPPPGPAVVGMANNGVLDMIADFLAGGALAHCPGYSNASFLPVINLLGGAGIGSGPGQLRQTFVTNWQYITAFPPPNMGEAFIAYINGVSNHLPVYAQFTV